MGLIIGIVVACAFLFYAISRKSSSSLQSKPQRSKSVSTSKSVEDALRVISSYASGNGYKISHFDPELGQIVLEEGASMTSYGFFFPIKITSKVAGGSSVEVGIKSRAFQMGPIVGRSHDKVVNGIMAALF